MVESALTAKDDKVDLGQQSTCLQQESLESDLDLELKDQQEQFEKLSTEKTHLQRQLECLQEAKLQMCNDKTEKEEEPNVLELKEQQEQFEKLSTEKTHLQHQLKCLQEAKLQLFKDKTEKDEGSNVVQEERTQAPDENMTLQDEYNLCKLQLSKLEEVVVQQEDIIKTSQAEAVWFREKSFENFNALKEQNEAYKKALDETISDRDDIAAELAEFDKQLEEAVEAYKRVHADYHEAQQALQPLRNNEKVLKEVNAEYKAEAEDMKKKYAELEKTLAEVTHKLTLAEEQN